MLRDDVVAFAGRLASMTHKEAADFVRSLGGRFSTTITRNTTLLVIGQDGWPLRKDGRPLRKLVRARMLSRAGHAIDVICEQDFLERTGQKSHPVGRMSLAELSELLEVPGAQVRRCIQLGLLESSDGGFTFEMVSRARTLLNLIKDGVPVNRIARSLQQLKTWLPDASPVAASLVGRRLVVRVPGGLAEPSGQLVFDFETDDNATIQIGDLFDQAVACESAGDFTAAAAAYRQLLEQEGPDADVCFNLANALYALGQVDSAVERYRQTVELDPQYADAWYNLANVLAEGGESGSAISAYGKALEIDPAYHEAHYGLSESLERVGQHNAARRHRQAYLKHEPDDNGAIPQIVSD